MRAPGARGWWAREAWVAGRGFGGGAARGAWGAGRDRESSVPPRQSRALNLSRARPVVRGPCCAGKWLREKGGRSSLAPGHTRRR